MVDFGTSTGLILSAYLYLKTYETPVKWIYKLSACNLDFFVGNSALSFAKHYGLDLFTRTPEHINGRTRGQSRRKVMLNNSNFNQMLLNNLTQESEE